MTKVGPPESDPEALLQVRNLKKHFDNESGLLAGVQLDDEFPYVSRSTSDVRAVDGVDFDIKEGETLGLVGESGCGKSTLARTVLRLLEPTEGSVYFQGKDLASLSGEPLRRMRKNMQMIFQDPQSSLDPRMKVGPIVEEPMKAHGMLDEEGREARAKELLEKVGLDPQHYNRYPHAFSGGQRQRVNLARALSVNPDFIVCDEPVSALDVSIQAQVLNTMEELQEEFDLTYLFIAHDLSVIRHISDRVAVMYLGNIVELADKEELFENPQHPYTQALLDAIPVPDPRSGGRTALLSGDVPSPIDPPSGCRFRTRCPKVIQPEEYDMSDGAWRNLVEFQRAVERRAFEETDPDVLRSRYFQDAVPSGDAGTLLDEALGHIERDKFEDAERILVERFADQSVCATARPAYEIESEIGDGRHYSACHLRRDEAVATAVDEATVGGAARPGTEAPEADD
ncbi:ABC transporter ATP-binding protein [Halorubrum ezzemoulense]|jgi:oligopeptide/dipeptide ABC transporter ATP-binding protein|uniref:ABC transporter ATP-binding protein n=2 Tax=Halorubrum ezzemoulense TaxID=337243 RepID=A0A238XJU5_HALEZ|nr:MULTISPECIES: oligopeptide/dipeptide ABC transporter ATP-binding protein [Halorubrum]MDB2224714.1 ATP-binding cassette domain-containing protein [Halorubrum ezzemoulense]MDB2242228.1 ATP-binding cassette domain-containing protein [Halorubrum ezzemoulense]MDB2261432.1 ATP-binding cassette domain-containing protein [Halorubrum ezzemoulense]MDB2264444.1 ATP-binding cassette domain-containing protein [Halorubrum ezzemoulense]MDB2271785.1 ATP-binding cassette domain-containing protein [Halorubru